MDHCVLLFGGVCFHGEELILHKHRNTVRVCATYFDVLFVFCKSMNVCLWWCICICFSCIEDAMQGLGGGAHGDDEGSECMRTCHRWSCCSLLLGRRGILYNITYIFKGCRPCRRPRKRETGNGVSWLRSSVLWIVSLDALYIHYIYIYMHQIVYTCMLKWNFASSYPCHEAQASILLLSVFRGWCVLLPVRKT